MLNPNGTAPSIIDAMDRVVIEDRNTERAARTEVQTIKVEHMGKVYYIEPQAGALRITAGNPSHSLNIKTVASNVITIESR